jgi:tRNA pseudouridine32 synthase / 23S rRNA pseudouridine746 synthase
MLLADRVLFIDAEAMILDKPAGLPVDRPRDGTLAVINHLDSLRFGFERQPTIVHRLDRDTSGCLLLARNPRAHRKFQQAFEAHAVAKTYLAVLDGVPKEPGGTIDMPLNKVSTREGGWRMIVEKRGQAAVTHWEVVIFGEGRALVAFRPETGRTHQLRVHAATGIGIPIIGDPVYGSENRAPPLHMLLHAHSLSAAREGKVPAAAIAPLPEHFPEWARNARV